MLNALFRWMALAALVAATAACTFLSPRGDKFFGVLTPYRVEVVQGNVVTKEMLAQIQPGLGRTQVREILGSPLLADVFHGDRWDYVFTIRRRGAEPQQRRVTIYFNADRVERFDAAELPSEREFVAAIDVGDAGKVPPLELTPEQIRALPAPKPLPAQPVAVPAGGRTRDYPPLER
jgi:outer membrane protein assembly factor BamE